MSEFTPSCLHCNLPLDWPAERHFHAGCAKVLQESSRDMPHSYLITDGDTGIYSGYNIGLDAHVENRGHYRKLIKEQGLREAG